MYDAKQVRESFATLAGLRQNENPDFGQLAPTLIYDPNTNVLINHPLLTIENLDMCAKNFGKYTFPAYVALTPYVTGDRVTDVNVNYEAIANSTGATPASSPASWKVLNLLDLYLQDVFINAAEDTPNEVFNKKRINGQTKTLLSSLRLYNGVGNMNDLIVKEGSLVGVEIRLKYSNNILAVIEKIGIQLSAAQDDLTFYVYHSSQLEPIATLVKNHTKVYSFQWHTAGTRLNYLIDDYDAGGVFYIMYDEDDLTGQAVKKNHNFNSYPCQYCDAEDVRAFNLYSKYISMRSVRVKAANRNVDNDIHLWDVTKTEYTPDNNWGLNFEVTMKCDLTRVLIQQRDVFKYAFRDMVTKKMLEVLANTSRQNSAETKVASMARLELTSTYAGGAGFMNQLEDSMKAVDFEFSELDDTCMPCNKKFGLGFGTASLAR